MNTMSLVELGRIDPNPWQVRMGEDEGHVRQIAASIAEQGLMQWPMGRVVKRDLVGGWVVIDPDLYGGVGEALKDEPEARVQLAFGNTRLAAYKLLAQGGALSAAWREMPVVIRMLTDEDMFTRGLVENIQRKQLNPVEEARAMKRYQDDFRKTSAQIGALFGMGDSGVRNKMRLLGLPEDVLGALGRGTITEGLARALLALFDLPVEALTLARMWEGLNPNEIRRRAMVGEISPALVYEAVEQIRARFEPKMELAPTPASPTPTPALPLKGEGEEAEVEWVGEMPAEAGVSVETPVKWEGETQPSVKVAADKARAEADERSRKAAEAVRKAIEAAAQVPTPSLPTPGPSLPEDRLKGGVKGVKWGEVQVVLSVTYMAEDGHDGGRPCLVSVRAGGETPAVAFLRENEFGLGGRVFDLMNEVKAVYVAAHPEEV